MFDERVGHRRDGLRRVEFTILALVQGNRDVTARQLARALAVTPPNVALWLDRLESRGLVSRERSVSDARMQHVRLTARARHSSSARCRRCSKASVRRSMALSAVERAMLVELLHKAALSRRKT